MLHYLLTRYPCKIVVTAPTTNQLYDALMSELKSWIKQLPDSLQALLEVKAERVPLRRISCTPQCSGRDHNARFTTTRVAAMNRPSGETWG